MKRRRLDNPTPGTIGFQHQASAEQRVAHEALDSLNAAVRFLRKARANWKQPDLRQDDVDLAFALVMDAARTLAQEVNELKRARPHLPQPNAVEQFLEMMR